MPGAVVYAETTSLASFIVYFEDYHGEVRKITLLRIKKLKLQPELLRQKTDDSLILIV